MNPSQILIATGIISSGLFIPFPGQVKPKPDKKPNIIYILAENEGEDSFSILPLLLDKAADYQKPEAQIQHSSRGYFVVRKGDWKLIKGLGSGGFSKPEKLVPKEGEASGQLFNLTDDPSETRNLYLQYPEKVEELTNILKKYQETGRSR